MGAILSSQALFAFKNTISFQSSISQMFRASNSYFSQALVSLSLSFSIFNQVKLKGT